MKIHIAYTIDIQGPGAAQFADQLVTGLVALGKTKSENDEIVVHILYANLDGDTILRCSKVKGVEIEWKRIPVSDLEYMQQFTKAPPWGMVRQWSGIVYARIWLARALGEIDRIIYLDVDTFVRKSLEPLWRFDLKGRMLGLAMGYTPEYGFNSGVMLMDLAAMRKDDKMWDHLDQFMRKEAKGFYLPDQTTINRFFKDEIVELPRKYNFPPKGVGCGVASEPGEIEDAVIWHFYFQGPKPHRLDELERCNVEWNRMLAEEGK